MKRLFRFATNLFDLDWHRKSSRDQAVLQRGLPLPGRLKVTPHDDRLEWHESTMRDGVPEMVASGIDHSLGPPLFEQTEYQIYVRAKDLGSKIEIRHRDPNVTKSLTPQEDGAVVHGSLNFRGQIGRSLFSIFLNGSPILDFEVEVFPTKIDYESDYQDMIGEVQSILPGLAYEYLRSTYQLGKVAGNKRPSRLEWLVLIESIVDELEEALAFIAHQPIRGLVRQTQSQRIEKVRRVDSRIRSQVRRGQGKGQLFEVGNLGVREKLDQSPAQLTLDTLEHQWLRHHLETNQRKLSHILRIYDRDLESTNRNQATAKCITRLQGRLSRLVRLEPIAAAEGQPPAGFASLQLVSAPGYREAYRLLMLLRMGIRLEGEFLKLSVKDLEVLYEYWSFLTIVKILQENYGPPKQLKQLFSLKQSGLSVSLKSGRAQSATFQPNHKNQIKVIYNPRIKDPQRTLLHQKPDILIQLKEKDWPIMQLVADAKYRVDATDEYRTQFGSFGPPKDAINVLHRYRDAILAIDLKESGQGELSRSVVQAAALFPMNQQPVEDFGDSRLWKGFQQFGIGAIPLLPSNQAFLCEWLLGALGQGSWSLADRSIAHLADQRSREWRVAASEPVFVAVLRSPGTREHLEWIQNNRVYYVPFAKNQKRQLHVAKLAFYLPKDFGEDNGISYVSTVEDFEIVNRSKIETPWKPTRSNEMILYRLGKVHKLKDPIRFSQGDYMPPRGRWTTRLGLERANTITQVALETEPEWRLLEYLQASGIYFRLTTKPPKEQNANNPKGRAWFIFQDEKRVRYDGANGFLMLLSGKEEQFMTLAELKDKL